MSAYICNGMTVSMYMLESILRVKGVGFGEIKKQSEGARGRHTHT